MAASIIGPNPFTPRSGQEPKVFFGRDGELETFRKHLERTKTKRFDHFVVVGGWGTGKTTLLKEFRKVAHAQRVLTSFLGVHEFRPGDLLGPVVQLLTHIPRNLPIKFDRLKKFSKYLQGIGVTLPVVGGGIEISDRKRFDGDPQELLSEGLIQLWHELKAETDAVVVFLDDVQLYWAVPEVLGVLKNVLSDDEILKKTGYLFVLAATEDGWSEFLRKNHPIGRYFVPILKIHPLLKVSTTRIVEATLKSTGVTFTREVHNAVYEYTEGHPFQMQILCSYLYENQIKGSVNHDQLDSALSQTLDELGPIILDPLYSSASEQEKIVLQSFSDAFRTYGFDEILKRLRPERIRISKGPLSTMLSRLTEKGMLVKSERGKYRLVNRLFSEFVARQ
jgi:hypothetical protein